VKHWKFRHFGEGLACAWCPTLADSKVDGFGTKREILKELKQLENDLATAGFKWVVSYTDLVNPHVMKFFAKLKFVPYNIDVKQETLWFKKEL
jgi:hypothetical protein